MFSKKESFFKRKNVSRFNVAKEVSGTVNPKDDIAMGDSNTGKLLVSRHFAPCVAVFAELNNGEYALFHANVPYYSADMKKFIELIKDKASEVVVFQKNTPARNAEKSPLLALQLTIHLSLEVKILCVEKYTGIIANASEKKIILFDKDNLKVDKGNTTEFYLKSSSFIAEKKLIPWNKTFENLSEKYKFELSSDGSCSFNIADKTVTVPSKLVPEHFKAERAFNSLPFI
ncbi:Uncharacterised protein [Legionella beliardensis]|uniref:Uncharacterized protein n=1 Tax=Legionella beliardensis TaxID=91822 RepID=A0A378I2D1_9GAMM|nr:hypothetical protein [Legionella beliardensis]STX28845.1 Uncharacterised protein [Legionella beliardensis]